MNNIKFINARQAKEIRQWTIFNEVYVLNNRK
jgi:hypothetical protein